MEGLRTTIAKDWFKFTEEDIFREAMNLYGVYELVSGNGEVLYVGVGNIRDELLTHLPSGSDPIMGASYFRYEITENINEAEKRQKSLLDEYIKKMVNCLDLTGRLGREKVNENIYNSLGGTKIPSSVIMPLT